MILNSNTEKVINLVNIVDDLNDIDKDRLTIHLLKERYFY